MCQLTLVSTNNILINQAIALNLMIENSRTSNKDGCGTFNISKGLFKTEKTASNLINLGRVGISGSDTSPILAHVRQATYTYNKKEVIPENSHPFEGTNYIVAHNGSLEFKDEKNAEPYKNKGLIDSAIFADQLEIHHTGNPVVDLQKTMELFNGKFALLVFHKPTATYYVARGRTAPLWKAELVLHNGTKGIVVNTEKASLDMGLLVTMNNLQLMGLDIKVEKSEILDIESIYRLDDTILTHVGKIVQTDKEVATTSTSNFTVVDSGGTTNTIQKQLSGLEKLTEAVVLMIREEGLDIMDLDNLAYHLLGKGLIDMLPADADPFLKLLQELVKRNSKRMRSMWTTMCASMLAQEIYKNYTTLQYPYFLTDWNIFTTTYAKFMRDYEERKKEEKESKEHDSL